MEMSLNEWVASTGAKREDSFDPVHREMYADIGYFLAQFAVVELTLTAWLRTATDSHDVQIFDILVRGMDAKVKLDRLRQAMRARGEIGPNLQARFDVFENQAIKLRNTLAHNAIAPHESSKERTYSLYSIAKQPLEVLNRPPESKPPDKVKSSRIWGMGLWLNTFAVDLGQLQLTWIFQARFEITEPSCPELLAGRE